MGTIKSVFVSIFGKMPIQVALFYDSSLHSQFDEIVRGENPDHVYFQLIRTARYAENIQQDKTLDYMDNFSHWTKKLAAQSLFPIRLLLNWEAQKVAVFEESVFGNFQAHCIISGQDKANLEFGQKSSISCVPNGVSTDYYQPRFDVEKEYDIGFIGNLGYYNNIQAARFLVKKILPSLESSLPGLKVLIAGARPAKEVLNLKGKGVAVQGFVPDIRISYASARIFVAPILLAVGLQNKILEAMAMGIPCITTTSVNEAIGAKQGEEILIADSAIEFAEQIKVLLLDDHLCRSMGQNGLEFVKNKYSWEKAVETLNNVLTGADRRIAIS